jgi:hypothetical protein
MNYLDAYYLLLQHAIGIHITYYGEPYEFSGIYKSRKDFFGKAVLRHLRTGTDIKISLSDISPELIFPEEVFDKAFGKQVLA